MKNINFYFKIPKRLFNNKKKLFKDKKSSSKELELRGACKKFFHYKKFFDF